jgi:hypothetical protein
MANCRTAGLRPHLMDEVRILIAGIMLYIDNDIHSEKFLANSF